MRLIPTLLIALLAALPTAAAAMCPLGGGGSPPPGGGVTGSYRVIEPVWTGSSVAPSKAVGAGGYLVALQGRKAPIGIWDDALAKRSHGMPFVKLEDAEAHAFAKTWGLAVPSVALCDAHGNVLDSVHGQLTAKRVSALIDSLPTARAATAEGLARHLVKAQEADAAGRSADALRTLAQIVRFTGYPACDGALRLREAITTRAAEAVAAARALPATEVRGALVAVKRAYPGTAAAEDAAVALASLR